MSAEILREAAALMRSRAEAATPGPWEAMVSDSGLSHRCLDARVITANLGDRVADVDYDGDAEGPHGAESADSYHIASWHPAVALAVADWLESRLCGECRQGHHFDRREMTNALAVARAYLGTPADLPPTHAYDSATEMRHVADTAARAIGGGAGA